MNQLSTEDILQKAIKYLVEGLAIAFALYFVTKRKMSTNDLVTVAVTGAAVLAILDMFSPLTGSAARQGAGFGLGATQVGFTGLGVPL